MGQDKSVLVLFDIGDDDEATGNVRPFCCDEHRQRVASLGNFGDPTMVPGVANLSDFGFDMECEWCSAVLQESPAEAPVATSVPR